MLGELLGSELEAYGFYLFGAAVVVASGYAVTKLINSYYGQQSVVVSEEVVSVKEEEILDVHHDHQLVEKAGALITRTSYGLDIRQLQRLELTYNGARVTVNRCDFGAERVGYQLVFLSPMKSPVPNIGLLAAEESMGALIDANPYSIDDTYQSQCLRFLINKEHENEFLRGPFLQFLTSYARAVDPTHSSSMANLTLSQLLPLSPAHKNLNSAHRLKGQETSADRLVHPTMQSAVNDGHQEIQYGIDQIHEAQNDSILTFEALHAVIDAIDVDAEFSDMQAVAEVNQKSAELIRRLPNDHDINVLAVDLQFSVRKLVDQKIAVINKARDEKLLLLNQSGARVMSKRKLDKYRGTHPKWKKLCVASHQTKGTVFKQSHNADDEEGVVGEILKDCVHRFGTKALFAGEESDFFEITMLLTDIPESEVDKFKENGFKLQSKSGHEFTLKLEDQVMVARLEKKDMVKITNETQAQHHKRLMITMVEMVNNVVMFNDEITLSGNEYMVAAGGLYVEYLRSKGLNIKTITPSPDKLDQVDEGFREAKQFITKLKQSEFGRTIDGAEFFKKAQESHHGEEDQNGFTPR